MKTYYAWLLSQLFIMSEYANLEDTMNQYTDDFIFGGVSKMVADKDKDDILIRVFGFQIVRG